jgi:hypothetical protein
VCWGRCVLRGGRCYGAEADLFDGGGGELLNDDIESADDESRALPRTRLCYLQRQKKEATRERERDHERERRLVNAHTTHTTHDTGDEQLPNSPARPSPQSG